MPNRQIAEDQIEIPARLIEGANAHDAESVVAMVDQYTGDMSLMQLARVLNAVHDEMFWRHQQVEDLGGLK